MSRELLAVSVEDAEVRAALAGLADSRIKAAQRRAVTKAARDANRLIKSSTRATYHRHPIDEHPDLSLFAAAAIKPVRVRTRGGLIGASLGYSNAGFYGRFLSRGTPGRTQSSTGRYTGALKGTDLIPRVTEIADRRFPAFINLELGAEIEKAGLR